MVSAFNTDEYQKGTDNKDLNYSSLFQQIPIAIGLYMGQDLLIEYANPMILQIWGREWDQVKNKPLFDALPEVRGQGYEAIFQQVFETGELFQGNEMPAYLTRKGKTDLIFINIQYEPFKKDGKIIGIIQTAIEVTNLVLARNKAESETKEISAIATKTEAERQSKILQDLFMNVPAMMVILKGADHVFELVNPEYQKIFPGRQLLGKLMIEALPELKDQPIMKILHDVYTTGETFVGNEELIMLDRFDSGKIEPFYFNFIYKARKDFDGTVSGILVFAVDVTAQVLARKSIEEAELKGRRLLEGISQITWTADNNGKNTFLNKQWYDFTGSLKDISIGESFISYLHPDDLEGTVSKWKECVSSGLPYEVEYRIRNSKNEYRWMLGRALPSVNQKGDIVEWVGTSIDIHDYKLLRENLQNLTKQLAAANKELENSNKDLVTANTQLQVINSDLDNFIYTASHDLKAPISNIEGLVYALIRRLSPEIIANYNIDKILKLMQESIDRFKDTIEDLTQITKVQKETGEDIVDAKVTEMITEVKFDLGNLIRESNALIEVYDSNCPVIRFSKKNLRSLIYNLVSNALKYRSKERDLVIKIKCYPQGEYQILEVEDNGLGINTNDQPKIFSMFKRLHTHVEGSGIGLYMVKKIIENSGGKIEVSSTIGEGSVFKVYFKNC